MWLACDRALTGMMTYTFARVTAALTMNVKNYFPTGKRWSIQLYEKCGKRDDASAHYKLEEFIEAYLEAAGTGDEKHGRCFGPLAARHDSLTLIGSAGATSDEWFVVEPRTPGCDSGVVTTHLGQPASRTT